MEIINLLASFAIGFAAGYFVGAWSTRKKARKMNELQPLLGVVLPPKEKK